MDANLLHISYEGNALEDPWTEAEDSMWTRSVDPVDAPNTPEYIELEFEKGNPVALNGERLSPAVMLTRLNELGGKHGVPARAHGAHACVHGAQHACLHGARVCRHRAD
jgi:argininosuccinate synthase